MGAYLNAGACAMEVKVLCRCVHTEGDSREVAGRTVHVGGRWEEEGACAVLPAGPGRRGGKRVRAAG